MSTRHWQEEYKRKLISAEEAAWIVKSGDRVYFTTGRQPREIGLALAARRDELRNVQVFVPTPDRDFGWYDPGWEESFAITVGFPMPMVKQIITERRCDIGIGGITWQEEIEAEVVITEVSSPDENGFCSFGQSVWEKKDAVRRAKISVAEVNPHLIRTFGDNFIHVSQIDYFVERTAPPERIPGTADLRGKGEIFEPPKELKDIAGYVSPLVKDGDTVEVGVGITSEMLTRLGIFDGKQDIGWHSEHTTSPIIKLVREGVINGKRKSLHQGKAVASAAGGTPEDLAFVNNNPLFELYPVSYVDDPKVIAAHDHMIAINNALAVDLTGQITSESIGPRIVGGVGGQLPFVIGALLSNGGRSVTVLPSTAKTKQGIASRIFAKFEAGTQVSLPRTLADYIVTEYGIARLRGKTQRQRVEEIIAIAHPDFRAELRKEAQKLFWP